MPDAIHGTERSHSEQQMAREEQEGGAAGPVHDGSSSSDDMDAYERLLRIGVLLAAELDLDKLLQMITDEATALCRAEFGAFFYNAINQSGESYVLYTLSGVPREAFSKFPMPRNTAVFAPTFNGEGPVRSGDITKDPRYGNNSPHHGMPEGHLAVRSYLAVPVVSRSGLVLGGLFFGHSGVNRFTAHDERLLVGVAAQASVGVDNARLFQALKRSEEAQARRRSEVEASEQRYRILSEAIPHQVWTAAPDGTLDYMNLRMSDYFGRRFDRLFDESWADVMPPEDLRACASLSRGALQKAEPYECEARFRRAGDATYRWHIVRAVPLFDTAEPARSDEAPRRILRWFGTITDITDRKEMEEATRFLADASALLTSSVDYETTLGNLARLAVPRIADWCAIDIRDERGSIRRLAVAHIDPTKVELAHELERRYPVHPDDPYGVPHVIRTGKPEIHPYISDELLAAITKDEEHLALARTLGLQSSMRVPLITHGKTLGAISLVSAESGRHFSAADLAFAEELCRRAAVAVENARLYTEARSALVMRDRALEEVKQLNASLEQRVDERTRELVEANRELESFSYTVSHDLRAPVRHISGFVDLLQRNAGEKLDEKSQRYVTTIREAAKQMGTLIDALLAFSRMGRAEMAKKRVALGPLLQDVLRDLAPDLEGRSIAWQIGDLPEVIGDPTMLKLALTNLTSNAVKYTRRKPEARIEIGAMPGERSREAVIYIRDNGVGFNMDYVHKLFGVFQRLHGPAEFEGTGIGLASVRRIIHRHGGHIWAEGAQNVGATFFLTLPIAKA